LKLYRTSQFKKDYKRAKRQGRDIKELRKVVSKLSNKEKLEPKYKDHKLFGRWNKHRECHIKSDWLLIYRIYKDTLILERLGTHPELFK